MKTGEPPLLRHASREDKFALLLDRVRHEFLEMPGLRLTPAQTARLWALDRGTSERILESLTEAGFLLKQREGSYLRVSVA
jgi:hypothetical protein